MTVVWSFLVTFPTLFFFSSSQSIFRDQFIQLGIGKTIEGSTAHILTKLSRIECSLRCTFEGNCKAHIYCKTVNSTCLFIQNQPTDGQTFIAVDNYTIYRRSEIFLFKKHYLSWSRQLPVVYRSFDYSFNLGLMRGSKLVTGKMNMAAVLDRAYKQYIDLGDLSEACITIPDTCGPEGAAVAFWMKINKTECVHPRGIISSREGGSKTHFVVRCASEQSIRIQLSDEGMKQKMSMAPDNGWRHFVLSYTGSKKIKIYYDGELVSNQKELDDGMSTRGNGRVFIGRQRMNRDEDVDYMSMEIDELMFFNEELRAGDVSRLNSQ